MAGNPSNLHPAMQAAIKRRIAKQKFPPDSPSEERNEPKRADNSPEERYEKKHYGG